MAVERFKSNPSSPPQLEDRVRFQPSSDSHTPRVASPHATASARPNTSKRSGMLTRIYSLLARLIHRKDERRPGNAIALKSRQGSGTGSLLPKAQASLGSKEKSQNDSPVSPIGSTDWYTPEEPGGYNASHRKHETWPSTAKARPDQADPWILIEHEKTKVEDRANKDSGTNPSNHYDTVLAELQQSQQENAELKAELEHLNRTLTQQAAISKVVADVPNDKEQKQPLYHDSDFIETSRLSSSPESLTSDSKPFPYATGKGRDSTANLTEENLSLNFLHHDLEFPSPEIVSVHESAGLAQLDQRPPSWTTSSWPDGEQVFLPDILNNPASVEDADVYIDFIGDQFSSTISDETMQKELFDVSNDLKVPDEEDNTQIAGKRNRDLFPAVNLSPLLEWNNISAFDSLTDLGTAASNCGHMVSYWIYQSFYGSWLQFSRFTFLFSQTVDHLISSIGLIHTDSLLFAYWFCENSSSTDPNRHHDHLRSSAKESIRPTISSVSADVPAIYQQIFSPGSDASYQEVTYQEIRRSFDGSTPNPLVLASSPVLKPVAVESNHSSSIDQSDSKTNSMAPSVFTGKEISPTFDTEFGSILSRKPRPQQQLIRRSFINFPDGPP